MPQPRTKIFGIEARKFTTPIAAFTMAGLLFLYASTSIRAAKRNARLHREADGGQLSWENENMRRHGLRGKIANKSVAAELADTFQEQIRGKDSKK